MSMRAFRGCSALILLGLVLVISACKKEIEEQQVYDNVIYEIDSTKIYSSSSEKNKQKTPTQYISILYSDLFHKSIPANDLSELSELNLAIGDKSMSSELILSHYLKNPAVDLPSESEMRNDVETFVERTYLLFYQRHSTPYEKIYLTEMINRDPGLSVEEIYTAFILSDEYYYY